jgi:hypothetical protein
MVKIADNGNHNIDPDIRKTDLGSPSGIVSMAGLDIWDND